MTKADLFPRCWCGHRQDTHRVSPVEPEPAAFGCLSCHAEGRADWAHRFERVQPNAQITTQRRQQQRGCHGKVKYPSLKAATHVAVEMHRQFPGQQFHGYRCLFDVRGDEHYHVGHVPSGPLKH